MSAGTEAGRVRNFTAATVALVAAMFSPAWGEDQTLENSWPRSEADGFTTIIGEDGLSPWKGLADYWYVKDGVFDGHQTKENSKQTFLIFPFILRDFELRLKYKFVSPEGNSGIQFRSKIIDPDTSRVGGYQADMDATGKFDGSIYDEAGVAGARDTLSNRGEKTVWNSSNERQVTKSDEDLQNVIHLGDWNDVVLVARGNHITYTINGHVMTDLIDESPKALRDGVLALQLHHGFTMEVQFKDGRIKTF
jgi:hypothetical protein